MIDSSWSNLLYPTSDHNLKAFYMGMRQKMRWGFRYIRFVFITNPALQTNNDLRQFFVVQT